MTHPGVVEAMKRPDFYPHLPEKVELIQTHISFIFIAGDCVYKVKKAVDFGFLDFTTLERRKHYCEEELRLNRRMAPDIYLDVVEIGEDREGRIVLGKGERIVEYALLMKRLPQERMLKKLLRDGAVAPSVMEAIARKLVRFHEQAATGGEIDRIGSVETISLNHEENFTQTERYVDVTIPAYQYAFIQEYIRGFIRRNDALLRKRVADHRIRDCHGDLHLEHICLADDVVIFDCIEFNERFRYEDVAAEVAFLAMDLDYNGYPDYGEVFVGAYIMHSRDPEVSVLLNFYRCYYAYVRGKVTSFRIDDAAISEAERQEAVAEARRYFDLSYSYAARLERPTLILTVGLMGTGKSELAQRIAPRLDAEVIRTDILRKEMLSIVPQERHREEFNQGIYADEVSRKTYAEALRRAGEKLREGKSVIIDASYKKREERVFAQIAAQELKADFFVIECICPEEIVRGRLEGRLLDAEEASDGRWELFQSQKADFDAVTEIPAGSHLIIDCSPTPEECDRHAVRQIRERSWSS